MNPASPFPPELLGVQGEPLLDPDEDVHFAARREPESGDVVVQLTVGTQPAEVVRIARQDFDAEAARLRALSLSAGRVALRMALLRRTRAR